MAMMRGQAGKEIFNHHPAPSREFLLQFYLWLRGTRSHKLLETVASRLRLCVGGKRERENIELITSLFRKFLFARGFHQTEQFVVFYKPEAQIQFEFKIEINFIVSAAHLAV